MQVYNVAGKIVTKTVDHTNAEQMADWLRRLFSVGVDQQNLVLGYYSLLLESGLSPSEAAIKTLETMGPRMIQGELMLDKLINAANGWMGEIGQGLGWYP